MELTYIRGVQCFLMNVLHWNFNKYAISESNSIIHERTVTMDFYVYNSAFIRIKLYRVVNNNAFKAGLGGDKTMLLK